MKDESALEFAIGGKLREAYYRAGYWREDDLWTSFEAVVDAEPLALALIEGENSICFRDLANEGRRFGSAALESGLQPGEVIIIHARHCIDAVVAIVGCAWAGLVPALLPPMFSVEQILGIVDNTRARTIIGLGEAAELERTRSAGKQAGLSLVLLPDGTATAGAECCWSAFLARSDGVVRARDTVSADDLALLIYSSGTTGMPKGVMHSTNTVRFTIDRYSEMQDIARSDMSLVVSAFGFVGSSVLGFYLSLLRGCTSVLARNWNVEATLELIERHRISHFLLMPTNAIDILASPRLDETDCSSVTRGVIAGLGEAQRLDARKRLCARPFPMYGMSESPGHVTGSMSDDWDHLRTTEGHWLRGSEVLICDDDDQPLPVGTQGNILLRGPNRFLGYYRNRELNQASLNVEGYFRSGDIGVIDGNGCMSFVTRSKDIIRRGGVTITPSDVETALRPHPRIRDVAVIGIPDDRLGERACACVISRDGAEITLEELTSFLEQRGFARYLWPESVRLCEDFPRTPSLKVQKNELRQRILGS